MCCVHDIYNNINRFNTLVKPVNNLLRETEDFDLPEIPRPSPQNISVLVSFTCYMCACLQCYFKDLKGYSKCPTKLLRTTDMG